MSEQFRLVFQGEVQEGQHASVVKGRLQALLKLEDAQAEKLFSGNAVVLKKAVDESTAARFQAAFKKAGAVLRIMRVSPEPASDSTPSVAEREQNSLDVLPVGSDVLRDSERRVVHPVDVDTSAYSLQGAVFSVPDGPNDDVEAPDVSHINLGEPGIRLSPETHHEEPVVPDVNFAVAEVGADIGERNDHLVEPLHLDVDFDVAEVGAVLGSGESAPPVAAPDVSHLKIQPTEE